MDVGPVTVTIDIRLPVVVTVDKTDVLPVVIELDGTVMFVVEDVEDDDDVMAGCDEPEAISIIQFLMTMILKENNKKDSF